MKKAFLSLAFMMALMATALSVQADAPLKPTNLTATSTTPTTVNLSWDAMTGVVGYKIYRNNTITPIASTSANSYVNSGLLPSTSYTYYVASYDASNTNSVLSDSFTVTTLADLSNPTVPTGVIATPMSSSRIDLKWTASTDNVGVKGYRIYRNGVQLATTSSLNYSDTGLAATTSYSYAVEAYDGAGHVSGLSTPVIATTLAITVDTSAPTVPSGLIATPISSAQINLAWTASTDNVAVTGYRIFRNAVQVATSTNIFYSDKGLTASTSYTYNISAFDAAGNTSLASAELTTVTLGAGQVINSNANIKIINGDKHGKLVNYRSNEIIKVAVFSTKDFSAKDIVNASVRLGGAWASGWQMKDVNKDGFADRIYSFRARDLEKLNGENNVLVFSGVTKDGKQIYAALTVRIKNAPNKFRVALEKKIEALKKKISALENKLNQPNKKTEVKNNKAEVEKPKKEDAEKNKLKKQDESKQPKGKEVKDDKKNNKSGKK
jgi:chitodextrinase